MKIHFCDLCNESVPGSDLESGRARTVRNRIICAACEAAMSHGTPGHGTPGHAGHGSPVAAARGGAATEAAPRTGVLHAEALHSAPSASGAAREARPAASSAVAWVAALALALAGMTIFVTDDRISALSDERAKFTEEIASKDRAIGELHESLGKANARVTVLEGDFARRAESDFQARASLEDRLAREIEAHERSATRLATLERDLAALAAKDVKDPALEKAVAELATRVGRSEEDLRALARTVESRPAVAAAREPAVPAVPAAPDWTQHLPGLLSTEEGVRWESVTALGATGDPKVVEHIVPLLKDASIFVRMAAARVLGELGARPAVPHLIDALEDSESAVREAAWIALRGLSGQDLEFDPWAGEAERARKVKAWRAWWEREAAG